MTDSDIFSNYFNFFFLISCVQKQFLCQFLGFILIKKYQSFIDSVFLRKLIGHITLFTCMGYPNKIFQKGQCTPVPFTSRNGFPKTYYQPGYIRLTHLVQLKNNAYKSPLNIFFFFFHLETKLMPFQSLVMKFHLLYLCFIEI